MVGSLSPPFFDMLCIECKERIGRVLNKEEGGDGDVLIEGSKEELEGNTSSNINRLISTDFKVLRGVDLNRLTIVNSNVWSFVFECTRAWGDAWPTGEGS
mmetsp:Transcript_26709/g.21993  ORF Transcript_26709/g.21993 Transcript_26709/m.21993 type:complete len:100 (+) Transcript_26709:225-524(+)